MLNALFLGFMFAFAVKAPLWPFHRWLPDAAVEATPASAVLMMAVVDKVGTFGMLRYCLQLFPDASTYFRPLIITLAVIGIVYGAILAIGQTDVMRLIAYTSISHFGFIILGIFAMTSQGQAGSTLYMVNHGISTAALFLIAGFLVSRRGTRLIADYGGVQKVAPVLAGTFLVAGLATLSLPGLAPFISEFLVLIGTFTRYPVFAVFATSALVLAAIYVLWMYQRMMTGPVKDGNDRLRDLVPREIAVVAPLIALLLVLGVYPKLALDVINPAVSHTLTTIDQPDPDTPNWRKARRDEPAHTEHRIRPAVTDADRVRRRRRRCARRGVPAPPRRYAAQLVLSLGGSGGRVRRRRAAGPSAHGAVGTYRGAGRGRRRRPALFLQGTILLVGILGILLIAERRIPAPSRTRVRRDAGGLDAFTPQASAVAGSVAEQLATKAGVAQTEVFPLTLFAVGGMLLFPASDDLLTMFVALEVLSLPLYLLCGLARRRRLLSQEAALKYFLLGRVLVGVLPLRRRAAVRLRRHARVSAGSPTRSPPGSGNTTLALIGIGAAVGGPAVQDRCGAVPLLDPRRLPGCAHTDHRVHGRRHQDRRVRRDAAHLLRRAARPARRLAARDVGGRDPHHGGRHGHGGHPDRRQADAGVFVGGACRVHPDRRDRGERGRTVRRRCSTCSPTDSARSARSPSSAWSATQPGDGRDRDVAVGGTGPALSPCRRGIFAVPAGVRRHPADQWLRQQVRGVQGRRRGRRRSRWSSSVSSPVRSPPTSTCGSSC